jgi:citrate synthase
MGNESPGAAGVISPGLENVPVAESAVSYIDGKRARLEYRGIAAETLAKESCFEETAYLLLVGRLPSQRELIEFDQDLRTRRKLKQRVLELMKCLPENGNAMGVLQGMVALLSSYYPAKPVTSQPRDNWDAVLRIVAAIPTIIAAFHRIRCGDKPLDPRDDLDHAGNFYWMLFERVPSPAVRKVLDACFVLHAEHTMNASTFSARVVGSTLADPYAVISAAIGTLSGPLHGGANEEVLPMLEEMGGPENARSWLEHAVASKRKIMGFGHRVYKVKDPRATVLQELAENVFAESGRPKSYDTAVELERAAAGVLGPKGIYPNVDFYSGIVYQALGIPIDLFTPIFALARSAGWLAHWCEQIGKNRIYRPEQVFVGKEDVDFVPLEQRS